MKHYVYIMVPESGLGYIHILNRDQIWNYLNRFEDVSNIIEEYIVYG